MERERELELVELAVAGDQAAITELWREHTPKMVTLAYFRTGSQVVAQDIVSQAWVRVLRRLPAYQPDPRGLGPWLFTVTKNLVVDYFKCGPAKYETAVERMEAGSDPLDQAADENPAEEVAELEIGRELRGMVRQLTAEQAQVIEYRFFQELSIEETATRMGKDAGAIKALQYRATRQLARLAGPHLRGR